MENGLIETPANEIRSGDRIVLNGHVYRVMFVALVRGLTVDIKIKSIHHRTSPEQIFNCPKHYIIHKVG